MRSTSAGVASSPKSSVTGSPGAICMRRKIRNEMPMMTGIAPTILRLSVFMQDENQNRRKTAAIRNPQRLLSQMTKGLIQCLERLIDLILVDVERRRDAQNVAVSSALADQQAIIPGQFHYPLGIFHVGLFLLADELHALHEPHAAHVADDRVFVFQLV